MADNPDNPENAPSLAPSFEVFGDVLSTRPGSMDPTTFSKRLGQRLLDAADEHSEAIPEGLYLTLSNLAKEQFECVPFPKYQRACEALGSAAHAIKAGDDFIQKQEGEIKRQEKEIQRGQTVRNTQQEIIENLKGVVSAQEKLIERDRQLHVTKDKVILHLQKCCDQKSALFKAFAEENGYNFDDESALPLSLIERMCPSSATEGPSAPYRLRKRKRDK